MKQIIEIFPVIVFFILYKKYDIYIASLGIAIASAVQVISMLLFFKDNLKKSTIFAASFAIIFGTITYSLHNAFFIKIKISIINTIMGIALIISSVIKKPLFKYIFEEGKLILTEKIYCALSNAWGLFFIFCAIANYYIAFYMSEETWVNFKIFGLLILNLIMSIITIAYVYKKNKNTNNN